MRDPTRSASDPSEARDTRLFDLSESNLQERIELWSALRELAGSGRYVRALARQIWV